MIKSIARSLCALALSGGCMLVAPSLTENMNALQGNSAADVASVPFLVSWRDASKSFRSFV